jgi:hypothetical protein
MQTGAADMISRTFLTVLHLLLIRLKLPPVANRKRASQRRCARAVPALSCSSV